MSLNLKDALLNSWTNPTEVLVEENSRIIEPVDKCYFTKSIEDLIEIKESYNDSVEELYKNIREATVNQGDVKVAFINFRDRCKTILDRVVRRIDFDTRNFSYCFKDRYKADMKKFSRYDSYFNNYTEKEFTIEKYTFKNIDKKIPNYEKLDKLFSKDIKKMKAKMISGESYKDISEFVAEFVAELTGSFYDDFRASLMGSLDPVYRETFADVCFSTFRNESEAVPCNASKAEVKEAYSQFKKSKDYISTIESDTINSKKQFLIIRSSIFDLDTTNTMDDEMFKLYSSYLKIKTNQLLEMMSIYILAVSAKMDAMSDLYIQNVNILDKALYNAKAEAGDLDE